VWVKQCPGWCYVALNGCLPWQLQRVFKINLLTKNGTFIQYWSALALTTIPESSGNLDPVWNKIERRNIPAAIA